MNPPAVDLEALRRLPVAERLLLVEDLWDSIATDTPSADIPMTPELIAELDRRVEDLKSGRERAIPWEEVRESILKDKLHGP
jgi:putative addiction module component (TIGR02574 family)